MSLPNLAASPPEQMSSKPDWNNLAVLHRNTLPPRSNFYIYDSVNDALTYDSAKSLLHSLSGTWKFNHARNPSVAPTSFELASYDLNASDTQWYDITVPSMWQLAGYGKGPQYTNVNFPIPIDPPHVPLDNNETGSYQRYFMLPEHVRGQQIRLRFEGVDAAFHVWVNGVSIGYHQGSRNPAEFDVTDHVEEGQENLLAVRVYQCCDGTYIEDQVQWRMSGIFRDVYLLGFPKESRIEDLFVHTILDAQYADATLNFRVDLGGPSAEVSLSLYNAQKDEIIVSETKRGSGSISFSLPVQNPRKWTAETPDLYHLVISINPQFHVAHRVGFRHVEIKDGLIKLNGQRIVLRGANRHEHHPKFDRSVPYEFMKKDLLLMKEYKINAIRTCHQPSDVRLYDLADELGVSKVD